MATFLKPLQSRDISGCCDLQFLWRSGTIYFMDNHKAALWCWLQHWSPDSTLGLIHIDMHNDLCDDIPVDTCSLLYEAARLPIGSFLDHKASHSASLRWDNYIYPFLHLSHNSAIDVVFCTHELSSIDEDDPVTHRIQTADLPVQLKCAFGSSSKHNWIVNLDLDYFFYNTDSGKEWLHSPTYRSQVFSELAQGLADERVACLTVALSPECCDGWGNAETIAGEVSYALDLDFSLPPDAQQLDPADRASRGH
jgi:hypothetical protein